MPAPDSPRRTTAPAREASTVLGVYFERHLQTLVASLGRLVRRPFASLMTIGVIGVALALPACLHVLVLNARAATGGWENALDVSVYLKKKVTLAQARQMAERLEARGDVANATVVPPDQALAEFRELSGFGAALDALTDNPLPIAVIVRPDPSRDSPEAMNALRDSLRALPEVDLVQIDTDWVQRFNAILDALRRAVAVAAVILAVAVLMVVGNTIRLDIDTRRPEIEVTKLLGGSDGFVRRPFLYSGFWYGFVGGIVAWLLVTVIIAALADPVSRLAGLYGSAFALRGLDAEASLLLLCGGSLLGWLGSWISATRHLRDIEPGV